MRGERPLEIAKFMRKFAGRVGTPVVLCPRDVARRSLEPAPEGDDGDELEHDADVGQELRQVRAAEVRGRRQEHLCQRVQRLREEVRDEVGRQRILPEEQDQSRAAAESPDVADDVEDREREDAPSHRQRREHERGQEPGVVAGLRHVGVRGGEDRREDGVVDLEGEVSGRRVVAAEGEQGGVGRGERRGAGDLEDARWRVGAWPREAAKTLLKYWSVEKPVRAAMSATGSEVVSSRRCASSSATRRSSA